MPRRTRMVFLCALFAGCVCLVSESIATPDDDVRHMGVEVWNSSDGLPQNTVQAIAQTADGYIWIGTQEGLVRFDGVRFTSYSSSTHAAFRHDDIQDLAVTSDGDLWIATYGGGVIRKSGETWTRGDDLGPLGPASTVLSLYIGPEERLWFGTLDEGLFYWEDGRIKDAGLPGVYRASGVFSVVEGLDGTLWVATNRGLVRRVDAAWERVDLPCHGEHSVNSLYQDPDGTVWAGTAHGVIRFREGEVVNFTPPVDRAWDYAQVMLRDREGELWVGAYGGGIYRMHDGQLVAYRITALLSEDSIHALFEDRDGSLWVGTTIGGVNRLRDTPFATIDQTMGLPSNSVRVIERDLAGDLWVGMDTGGLARVRGDDVRVYTMRDGMPGTVIHALAASRDGSLWLGTDRGVSNLR